MLSTDAKRLEDAYEKFNDYYFESTLPNVMITIQSSRGAYGHCTTQKVWASGEERYYELNLGAEYLDRPIENVLATLMHEMVHIYCMENGIKDTSNLGRYHNKRFKQEAEKRGLIISKHDYIGWSVTHPSPQFISVIKQMGLDAPCENCRVGEKYIIGGNDDDSDNTTITVGPDNNKPRIKKPSSTRKYLCPFCGISVRATKDVNIICADCVSPMLKVT